MIGHTVFQEVNKIKRQHPRNRCWRHVARPCAPTNQSLFRLRRMQQGSEGARESVAKELMTSEKSYVDNLELCLTAFFLPMKEKAINNRNTKRPRKKEPFVTVEEIDLIFSSMFKLFHLHKPLLAKLTQRATQWGPDSTIADIFLTLEVCILRFFVCLSSKAHQRRNSLRSMHDTQIRFLGHRSYCSVAGREKNSDHSLKESSFQQASAYQASSFNPFRGKIFKNCTKYFAFQ